MQKKILVVLTILTLLTGCGAKYKAWQAIQEKRYEALMSIVSARRAHPKTHKVTVKGVKVEIIAEQMTHDPILLRLAQSVPMPKSEWEIFWDRLTGFGTKALDVGLIGYGIYTAGNVLKANAENSGTQTTYNRSFNADNNSQAGLAGRNQGFNISGPRDPLLMPNIENNTNTEY